MTARARWSGRSLAVLALVAGAAAWPSPAPAGDARGKPATPAPARPAASRLEERVAMLARALDLDASQQGELRKALEDQRDQLLRVWSDTSVDAATRIGRAQAVGDRTTDRIRALLTEEQRRRWGPPRQPREGTAASSTALVDAWTRPAAPGAPATSPAVAPPRVSPYAVAARRQAQAPHAADVAHAPAVPPTMRRTRQPMGEEARR